MTQGLPLILLAFYVLLVLICHKYNIFKYKRNMKIETNGIIINLRPFGDKALIAKAITPDFGVVSGLIKAGQTARRKIDVGQLGEINWGARLEDHLGIMRFNEERNLSAPIMSSEQGILILNSVCAMLADTLPERAAHADIYFATLRFLTSLPFLDDKIGGYVAWEEELLDGLGYGLHLTECAGCGKKSDLVFLSPKTGRAVCGECGRDFSAKLLKLPIKLSDLTFFFEKVSEMVGKKLPLARGRLVDYTADKG
jgi:DNA repair protein RecO (recombination protein O)